MVHRQWVGEYYLTFLPHRIFKWKSMSRFLSRAYATVLQSSKNSRYLMGVLRFFSRKYFDNFHQNTFNWGLLKCTVFEIEAEQFFASHCLTDFIQNRIIHLYHFDFCLNGFMGHFPTIRTFREVMLQDMHHIEWQIITCVIHFYHSYANYTDTHFAFTLNRHESAKLLKYTLLSTLLLNVKNFTKCE